MIKKYKGKEISCYATVKGDYDFNEWRDWIKACISTTKEFTGENAKYQHGSKVFCLLKNKKDEDIGAFTVNALEDDPSEICILTNECFFSGMNEFADEVDGISTLHKIAELFDEQIDKWFLEASASCACAN